MELRVTRRWFSPHSTCGMLDIGGVFFCYSLERQLYREGMEKPYAIPEGTFPIELIHSPHFDMTVPHVKDVPNFEAIEIHPANWPSDLRGCTGVGSEHYEDYLDPNTGLYGGAVLGSRVCFAALMEKLKFADSISITYTQEKT